ncbi:spore germination protein [Brevibacillus agri]|uniref:spore germination protein n=1 Tax=Brevibacillus agri TaxID=51101 RepID=UPI0009DFE618
MLYSRGCPGTPPTCRSRKHSGSSRKRSLAICHLKGSSSDKIAKRVMSLLSAQQHDDIGNIQDIARIFGQRSWSPVPLFFTSEIPEEAVALLLKGRVLLLLDQLPYALIAPPLISDLWTVYSDKNLPKSLMFSIQWLRILERPAAASRFGELRWTFEFWA